MSKNTLSKATSPYLRQHKDNPVHWREWSLASLAEASASNRPILLSIGYAACHWCHVMAHESFENQTIADLMNAHFIPVKVDREERPDLDAFGISALHAMGEQGGWPLTLFLTPEGEPFWGGTYFPPEDRYGRTGFPRILEQIAQLWAKNPDQITDSAASLMAHLSRTTETTEAGDGDVPKDLPLQAARMIAQATDGAWGGLKGAPKFPQSPLYRLVEACARKTRHPSLAEAVDKTLTMMVQGGIYDHLAGGLARYSVDSHWLVPHFEKMLYDNAQLISQLSRAILRAPDPLLAWRLEETIDFVLSAMKLADETFGSSYDADSEGGEGSYYVWTRSELDALLGSRAQAFAEAYDVTAAGNWEGHTILNRLHTPGDSRRFDEERAILRAERNKRPAPAFDDKTLTDWNALMIVALLDGARALNRPDWQTQAQTSYAALKRLMWTKEGLHHSARAGQRSGPAIADDYALLIAAGLALHGATGQAEYLEDAQALDNLLTRDHADPVNGGYFLASSRARDLPLRQKTSTDGVTPNAHGTMVNNLALFWLILGEDNYRIRAQQLTCIFAQSVRARPLEHTSLLLGLQMLEDPVQITARSPSAIPQGVWHHTGLDVAIRYEPKDGIGLCRGQMCAPVSHTAADLEKAATLLDLKYAALLGE